MAHLDNTHEFTEKDVLDEVNTFMFEGHDTASCALVFTILLIANDSRVQQKIVDELSEILGIDFKDEGDITMDHCGEMKYLEMAIKESLRLYPSVPIVARQVTHDFEVQGYRIPAGCSAGIFIELLHRDPEIFPFPERFIPERFESPDASVNRIPFAYMPFSAGPRNFIGQKFALMEMKIVLALLLRRYRLTAVTKRNQLKMGMVIVLKALGPVVVRFDPR